MRKFLVKVVSDRISFFYGLMPRHILITRLVANLVQSFKFTFRHFNHDEIFNFSFRHSGTVPCVVIMRDEWRLAAIAHKLTKEGSTAPPSKLF